MWAGRAPVPINDDSTDIRAINCNIAVISSVPPVETWACLLFQFEVIYLRLSVQASFRLRHQGQFRLDAEPLLDKANLDRRSSNSSLQVGRTIRCHARVAVLACWRQNRSTTNGSSDTLP